MIYKFYTFKYSKLFEMKNAYQHIEINSCQIEDTFGYESNIEFTSHTICYRSDDG